MIIRNASGWDAILSRFAAEMTADAQLEMDDPLVAAMLRYVAIIVKGYVRVGVSTRSAIFGLGCGLGGDVQLDVITAMLVAQGILPEKGNTNAVEPCWARR